MRVISIQSHVAEGHVGNSAAVFPMQRLGVEVVPVHTLQFSNHPGHGAFRGRVFEAAHIAEVLAGLAARGAVERCDAILSGYLGSAEIVAEVADFVSAAKRANPRLIYACDPVIGDRGKGVYIRPEAAAAMRDRLVPLADVLFPNQFELEFLTGRDASTAASFRAAALSLQGSGKRIVVVTSVDHDGIGKGKATTAAFEAGAQHEVSHRAIPQHYSGAGDCFAGLFLAYWLKLKDVSAALRRADAALAEVLRLTQRLGRKELALVEGQRAFKLPAK